MTTTPTSPLSPPLSPISAEIIYTVISAHQPQHDGEIKLKPGDVISNVKDLGNGWSLGQNLTRDRVGIFPSACVQPLPGDGASSQFLHGLVVVAHDDNERERTTTTDVALTSGEEAQRLSAAAAARDKRRCGNETPRNSAALNSQLELQSAGTTSSSSNQQCSPQQHTRQQQRLTREARCSQAARADAHTTPSPPLDAAIIRDRGITNNKPALSGNGSTTPVSDMSAEPSSLGANSVVSARHRAPAAAQRNNNVNTVNHTLDLRHNDTMHQNQDTAASKGGRHQQLTSFKPPSTSAAGALSTANQTATASDREVSASPPPPTNFTDIRRVIAKKLGPQAPPPPTVNEQQHNNEAINTGEPLQDYLTTTNNDVRQASSQQPQQRNEQHTPVPPPSVRAPRAASHTPPARIHNAQRPKHSHPLVSPVYDIVNEASLEEEGNRGSCDETFHTGSLPVRGKQHRQPPPPGAGNIKPRLAIKPNNTHAMDTDECESLTCDNSSDVIITQRPPRSPHTLRQAGAPPASLRTVHYSPVVTVRGAATRPSPTPPRRGESLSNQSTPVMQRARQHQPPRNLQLQTADSQHSIDSAVAAAERSCQGHVVANIPGDCRSSHATTTPSPRVTSPRCATCCCDVNNAPSCGETNACVAADDCQNDSELDNYANETLQQCSRGNRHYHANNRACGIFKRCKSIQNHW